MFHSSFINSCCVFSERLEIELEQKASMAKHLSNAPSISVFHLCKIWSYFRSFITHSPPNNAHLVSATDEKDAHRGKGSAQEQLVMDQEFMSYADHKSMEDYE
jgi:hypothetical protein